MTISISREPLIVWSWLTPHFNRNSHFPIHIRFNVYLSDNQKYHFLTKMSKEQRKKSRFDYLLRSYDPIWPLFLTGIATFLFVFYIMYKSQSTLFGPLREKEAKNVNSIKNVAKIKKNTQVSKYIFFNITCYCNNIFTNILLSSYFFRFQFTYFAYYFPVLRSKS